jgi:hypothetical protein
MGLMNEPSSTESMSPMRLSMKALKAPKASKAKKTSGTGRKPGRPKGSKTTGKGIVYL